MLSGAPSVYRGPWTQIVPIKDMNRAHPKDTNRAHLTRTQKPMDTNRVYRVDTNRALLPQTMDTNRARLLDLSLYTQESFLRTT